MKKIALLTTVVTLSLFATEEAPKDLSLKLTTYERIQYNALYYTGLSSFDKAAAALTFGDLPTAKKLLSVTVLDQGCVNYLYHPTERNYYESLYTIALDLPKSSFALEQYEEKQQISDAFIEAALTKTETYREFIIDRDENPTITTIKTNYLGLLWEAIHRRSVSSLLPRIVELPIDVTSTQIPFHKKSALAYALAQVHNLPSEAFTEKEESTDNLPKKLSGDTLEGVEKMVIMLLEKAYNSTNGSNHLVETHDDSLRDVIDQNVIDELKMIDSRPYPEYVKIKERFRPLRKIIEVKNRQTNGFRTEWNQIMSDIVRVQRMKEASLDFCGPEGNRIDLE